MTYDLQVSKQRSEKANHADYHEWSVSDRLNAHPNVLQITGLCPDFSNPLYAGVGTTALIAPLQENGGLADFFSKRARCFVGRVWGLHWPSRV